MSDVNSHSSEFISKVTTIVLDTIAKQYPQREDREKTRLLIERVGIILVASSLESLPEPRRSSRALALTSKLVGLYPHPDPLLTKMLEFLVKDCTSVEKIEKMVNSPTFAMAGKLADTILSGKPTNTVNH
jgi:hypothetical protein